MTGILTEWMTGLNTQQERKKYISKNKKNQTQSIMPS